jgi:hypothetical protein
MLKIPTARVSVVPGELAIQPNGDALHIALRIFRVFSIIGSGRFSGLAFRIQPAFHIQIASRFRALPGSFRSAMI